MNILSFLFGTVVGSIFGVIVMALCAISGKNRMEDE